VSRMTRWKSAVSLSYSIGGAAAMITGKENKTATTQAIGCQLSEMTWNKCNQLDFVLLAHACMRTGSDSLCISLLRNVGEE